MTTECTCHAPWGSLRCPTHRGTEEGMRANAAAWRTTEARLRALPPAAALEALVEAERTLAQLGIPLERREAIAAKFQHQAT